jgi:hypothetical protein
VSPLGEPEQSLQTHSDLGKGLSVSSMMMMMETKRESFASNNDDGAATTKSGLEESKKRRSQLRLPRANGFLLQAAAIALRHRWSPFFWAGLCFLLCLSSL